MPNDGFLRSDPKSWQIAFHPNQTSAQISPAMAASD